MEVIFKIWTWLAANFTPIEAVMFFGFVLILLALYRHILSRQLDTIGEWCELKLRKALSLPTKNPPHR